MRYNHKKDVATKDWKDPHLGQDGYLSHSSNNMYKSSQSGMSHLTPYFKKLCFYTGEKFAFCGNKSGKYPVSEGWIWLCLCENYWFVLPCNFKVVQCCFLYHSNLFCRIPLQDRISTQIWALLPVSHTKNHLSSFTGKFFYIYGEFFFCCVLPTRNQHKLTSKSDTTKDSTWNEIVGWVILLIVFEVQTQPYLINIFAIYWNADFLRRRERLVSSLWSTKKLQENQHWPEQKNVWRYLSTERERLPDWME